MFGSHGRDCWLNKLDLISEPTMKGDSEILVANSEIGEMYELRYYYVIA